jgi:glycine/D-amino acid oxidase-like deaminating enzyme
MNYSVNAKLPLADRALRPDPSRASPWLREALAAEGDPAPAPPLSGEVRADIGIVGGGYTGLWTALQLKMRAPTLEVVVLEQAICGAGPSGRNGGFVNAWWDELDTLRDLHGDQAALDCAREVAKSVSAIGEWAMAEGEDVHYRRGGMLTVSTTPLHDGAWRASVDAARELGVPDAYRELDADAVAARCHGERFRGGALMADAATVHPGRLIRALRRACLARGVRLFEETRAGRLRAGDRARIATTSRAGPGELHASQLVLALNAWAAGWRPFRRSLLAWSSWMVRTEPIPGLIAARLGWTGGESIVDGRFTVHYFHVTRDGRIAFGAGGGRPGYDGRIGRSFREDPRSGRRAAAGFRRLFPQLADVRLTDMWGGPIDVSADHLPRFGTLPGGRVHFGFGYSGNGVAPSHLGGRILSSLALGSDEPVTRLALVGDVPRRLPPEPFRYLGAHVVRAAMIRREDREEAGRRPSWPLREITRLPRRLGLRLGPE